LIDAELLSLTISASKTATAMVLITALIGLLSSGLALAQQACPGYRASNVQQSANGLTADLNLAGPACNIFGTDLRNLTLTVEYQTGKRSLICQLHPC
jgi:hypothetical protein